MMKEPKYMDISAFKAYSEAKEVERVILHSLNQGAYNACEVPYSLSFSLVFSGMRVLLNPASIVLQQGESCFAFHGVTGVKIHPATPLGEPITVICEQEETAFFKAEHQEFSLLIRWKEE